MTVGFSLLVSAVPSELADLYSCPPPGWHTRCTGVGAIMASVVTARLLMMLKPSKVLFIGTCGSYNLHYPLVGSFLRASCAVSASLDVLEDRAYRLDSEPFKWSATLSLPVSFPALSVAVPPGITRTCFGAKLLSSIAEVEHLELTGVFAACHEANIPCGAILAVANQVGPEAHAQWLANHMLVSSNLVDTLKSNNIFNIL